MAFNLIRDIELFCTHICSFYVGNSNLKITGKIHFRWLTWSYYYKHWTRVSQAHLFTCHSIHRIKNLLQLFPHIHYKNIWHCIDSKVGGFCFLVLQYASMNQLHTDLHQNTRTRLPWGWNMLISWGLLETANSGPA